MLKNIYKLYTLLFARKWLFKFNKLIYNLSIRGLGIYNYSNMNVSGESNFIQKHLAKQFKQKAKVVVFDVGANIGEYSKIITTIVNNSVIYSFEPHPITYEMLKANVGRFKNIKTYKLALSNSETTLDLYDYANKDSSSHASLNSEIFSTIHNSKTTSHKVKVTTIDNFIKANQLTYIDFLKIDVEGFEREVLLGASKSLAEKKISIIQFEFTQLNSTTKVFFKEFYDLLSENYKLYRLLPKSMIHIKEYEPTMNEIFGYQNYVAILKSL